MLGRFLYIILHSIKKSNDDDFFSNLYNYFYPYQYYLCKKIRKVTRKHTFVGIVKGNKK